MRDSVDAVEEAATGRGELRRVEGDGHSLAELFGVHGHGPANAPRAAASIVPARREARRRTLFGRAVVVGTKSMVILCLIWGLFFNFSEVRGSSMRPGISDGDRILVDHVTLLFAGVDRGDIVVLRYPLDPSIDYVKRIVGLPGEHVVIERGQVWIDGERVDEPYVSAENIDPYAAVDTVVEPGHYFVLGDNRARSSDSRDFGLVPREYLRGEVRLRLWPLERAGTLD